MVSRGASDAFEHVSVDEASRLYGDALRHAPPNGARAAMGLMCRHNGSTSFNPNPGPRLR